MDYFHAMSLLQFKVSGTELSFTFFYSSRLFRQTCLEVLTVLLEDMESVSGRGRGKLVFFYFVIVIPLGGSRDITNYSFNQFKMALNDLVIDLSKVFIFECVFFPKLLVQLLCISCVSQKQHSRRTTTQCNDMT